MGTTAKCDCIPEYSNKRIFRDRLCAVWTPLWKPRKRSSSQGISNEKLRMTFFFERSRSKIITASLRILYSLCRLIGAVVRKRLSVIPSRIRCTIPASGTASERGSPKGFGDNSGRASAVFPVSREKGNPQKVRSSSLLHFIAVNFAYEIFH